MSDKFDQSQYKTLREITGNVIKKKLNYQTRPVPTDPEEREARIDTYKTELVGAYNNLISYTDKF